MCGDKIPYTVKKRLIRSYDRGITRFVTVKILR